WKKNEGDTVAAGDVLAEVETDKAVMELVARAAGTLLKQVIPIGKADVKREGSDVTIVCHSKTVTPALKAAEALAAENISAEVLDLRTIRPLDHEALFRSATKTHRVVVAEEGWPFAGVGAQVVDDIQREVFDELDAPVLRVTGADVPMPYNKHLEKAAKADAPKIVAACKKVLYV
ncbi:MAG TPA: transketolase C-terminal domain-containing protein, partial [Gemmatimonadales bacterium]|nr:transketolase C-terminal domain-containing protein [Gemmatimonadales bacterium]